MLVFESEEARDQEEGACLQTGYGEKRRNSRKFAQESKDPRVATGDRALGITIAQLRDITGLLRLASPSLHSELISKDASESAARCQRQ